MSDRPRLCVSCSHFVAVGCISLKCMRRAKKRVDPVRGRVTYTRERDAESERASWFGCGKSGRYWTPKDAV